MLPITSIFASLAVFMYIALAFRVIAIRRDKRISLGTADMPELETRVRQHGNFNEYAPLSLILIALAELQDASSALLILAGTALLLSRLAHCIGLERMSKPMGMKLRILGMLSSFALLITLAITLLVLTLF
jgi:uncharacterized membrane protein YecN with MAPEG domain